MAEPIPPADRRRLRRELRVARRALPADTAKAASLAICRRVAVLPAFRRARRVAAFLAFDGEPDLTPLFTSTAARGKQLFVPAITKKSMRFVPWSRRATLEPNFFGIMEPRAGVSLDARALDLVLTPLVAFDSAGTRLGVGRGYYDRAFAFLRLRRHWQRPKLLGVAYDFQHVAHIGAECWDVPLWGAVTEKQMRRFQRSAE